MHSRGQAANFTDTTVAKQEFALNTRRKVKCIKTTLSNKRFFHITKSNQNLVSQLLLTRLTLLVTQLLSLTIESDFLLDQQVQSQNQNYVTTDGQSASHPSEAQHQTFITVRQLRVC
jgi:hypothetical protein